MISILQRMRGIEEGEQRQRALFDAVFALTSGIADHAVSVSTDLLCIHRTRLRSLKRDLAGSPTLDRLASTVRDITAALQSYAAEAGALLQGREQDVKAVVASVAEISQALAVHHEAHGAQLGTLAEELHDISALDDLTAIRQKLSAAASSVKSVELSFSAQARAAVLRLQDQLAAYEARLAEVEALAFTDRVTGVCNRAEGERRLAALIEAEKPFCVMLFDLDRFKQINDRYGHPAGDQMLKEFAQRLAQGVRPSDVVSRWGGDEFLVILEGCALPQAINRAKLVSRDCCVSFTFSSNGETVRETIQSSVGTAERRAGETRDELLHRVDTLLYRAKNTARTQPVRSDGPSA